MSKSLRAEPANLVNGPEMPLTAAKMTRYAPLRVVLFEDEQGRGLFEYAVVMVRKLFQQSSQ
jgi:hypothetical protein